MYRNAAWPALAVTLAAILSCEPVAEDADRVPPNPDATAHRALTRDLGRAAPGNVSENWRRRLRNWFPDEPSPSLKNADLTSEIPGIGLLIQSDSGGNPEKAECTGTLIDAATFVTAAHCIRDRSLAYWVYLQHVGIARGSEPDRLLRQFNAAGL